VGALVLGEKLLNYTAGLGWLGFIHSQKSSAKATLPNRFNGSVAIFQKQLGATTLANQGVSRIFRTFAIGIEAVAPLPVVGGVFLRREIRHTTYFSKPLTPF
jgi:hypothetical protein